jgi:type IV pilus assembly protein PilC
MTLHRYRAITADGRRVRGTADATGLDELEARLRARGLELINGEACRAQP